MSSNYKPYNSPAAQRFAVGTRKPLLKTRNVPKAKQTVDTYDTQAASPDATTSPREHAGRTPLGDDTKLDPADERAPSPDTQTPVSEDKSEEDSLEAPTPHSAKTQIRQKLTHRPLQKPGRRDIPVSIENEHRFINSTVNNMLSEVRKFRQSYKSGGFDFDKCMDAADEVLKKLHLQDEHIEDSYQFRKLLGTHKIGNDLRERPGVEDLVILCDKSSKYEGLIADVQSKLTNTLNNHLAKYCLSFEDECKHVHIRCVHDYQQHIKAYKASIEENLKAMGECVEEYNSLKSPFVQGYLHNGQRLMQLMEQSLAKLPDVCNTMRRWLIADKAYPTKLWDEVLKDNKEKARTLEDLKKVRQTKEEHSQAIQKKEIVRDKAAVKFGEAKMEKRKLKTHKENLADRFNQSEKELVEKEASLKEVTHAYNNRKSNSAKLMDQLTNQIEVYEQELGRIEERLGMLKRQRERYDKLDCELEDQVTEYEYDLMGKQGDVDSIRSRIRACDNKINGFLKDLKTRDAKITAAKTVRDMKLSPATLRKIYFQKMDTTSQDVLMEVCRVVSVNIGREWEGLYLDLQFSPPRSTEKRLRDLGQLKLHSVQREVTGRTLAWQALQKWRIFNKRSSVQQIGKSLRKLDKYALAHKVENMYKAKTSLKS